MAAIGPVCREAPGRRHAEQRTDVARAAVSRLDGVRRRRLAARCLTDSSRIDSLSMILLFQGHEGRSAQRGGTQERTQYDGRTGMCACSTRCAYHPFLATESFNEPDVPDSAIAIGIGESVFHAARHVRVPSVSSGCACLRNYMRIHAILRVPSACGERPRRRQQGRRQRHMITAQRRLTCMGIDSRLFASAPWRCGPSFPHVMCACWHRARPREAAICFLCSVLSRV
jgi:hypothetical protein